MLDQKSSSALSRQRLMFGSIMLASAAIYILGICGHHPLSTNETYSLWAASKPGVRAIFTIPVLEDPGKQILYYMALHYFVQIWGYSESAARSLSMIFSLSALALVYTLACDLFDPETGVASLAMWAFSPLAIFFAYNARCYSMFIFLGLAQMIALWRLRAAPTRGRVALCGIVSAALLYTHMASLLIIGSEAAMLVRDFARERRFSLVWLALGVAAVLFAPYLPFAMSQSHELVMGHWLDWAGTPDYSLPVRVAVGCVAGALGILMVFGPAVEPRRDEPLRWLLAWSLLPIVALLAASIVLRPMFNLRYVVPSVAVLAILITGALTMVSPKWRNLLAGGFAVACLLMVPFAYPRAEPWPRVASLVASERKPAQPVFFEAGFTARGPDVGIPNGGFPHGYYAVPFDYYFRGPNPRTAVPAYDPDAARAKIAAAVGAHGGAWLISWKENDVAAELPDARRFRVTKLANDPPLAVYRIVPIETAAP